MRNVSNLATRLLVIGVLVVGVSACGGGGGPDDLGPVPTTIELPSTTVGAAAGSPEPATPPTLLPDYASLVANARTSESVLPVYDTPDQSAKFRLVPESAPVTGGVPFEGPHGFRVESQRADGWVQVQLPYPKPKGSSGWVRDSDVTITQVTYRMRVALGTEQLTVFGRGRQIYRGPIEVGPAARATPAGHYYLRGYFTAPTSRMTDSAFVYGLIPKLSNLVPLGTPVDIVS